MGFLEKYGRGIFFIVTVNAYFMGNFYFLSASTLADRYLQSFFGDAMVIVLLLSIVAGKLVIEAMFVGHIPLLVAYVSIYGILASGYMWWSILSFDARYIAHHTTITIGQQIVIFPLLALGLIAFLVWKSGRTERLEKLVIGDVRKTEIREPI